MYACVTDYAAIYNDKYRGHRANHTSFDRDVLPPLIVEFCQSRGIRKALDVSGGAGGLRDLLREKGFEAFVTDISSQPERNILLFDLSQYDNGDVDRVKRSINYGNAPHLTTCFDVLEHIDREHIASAVRNLFELTYEFLIVSISTRPSMNDNLLHASLMPIETWISAFQGAGFICETVDMFAPATTRRTFPTSAEYNLINAWVEADLFNDVALGEPRYLLLRKSRVGAPDWKTVVPVIEQITDIAFRRLKRDHFAPEPATKYVFNIHHIQEWQYFRPLLDVLRRDQVRVLIRNRTLDGDFRRAICGWLTRNGVAISEYDDVADIDWLEMRDGVLFTGGESSVSLDHVKSQQIVAAARLNRCRTIVLQHGIWPRPFDNAFATFASRHVVTWGAEEAKRINCNNRTLLNGRHPWGILPPEQDVSLGSPKYADQLLAPPNSLIGNFGDRNPGTKNVVLLAVKNMRGRFGVNNFNNKFHQDLRDLFSKNPDSLFIIRPHPADKYSTFKEHRAFENVRVLDSVIGALADISMSRIIPGCDIVATSPSTMILDGVVSAKKTFVYGTGQPSEYDHVKIFDFSALAKNLASNEPPNVSADQRFLSQYGGALDRNFYRKLSDFLPAIQIDATLDREVASIFSLATALIEKSKEAERLKVALTGFGAAVDDRGVVQLGKFKEQTPASKNGVSNQKSISSLTRLLRVVGLKR